MNDMTLKTPRAGQSLRELVLWGEKLFESSDIYFGHGTDNALDEALYIAAYALGEAGGLSDEDLEKAVDEQQLQTIENLFERRITERVPAAYLIHEAWFCGLPFYVDERVLVPRSPIAELILEQFQPWIEPDTVQAVLDLCTGSGCIGIACAMAFPEANVTCSDLSADALAVAQINVQRYQCADRVRLVQSDLFRDIPRQRYDIIVSNPPYVDAEDMASLPDEYRHEPEMGLAAGPQGLDMVIPMLRDAGDFLTEHGILIIEVGNSAEALQNQFPDVPFMWLEFEYGGDGVFLLEAEQVRAHHDSFTRAAEELNS